MWVDLGPYGLEIFLTYTFSQKPLAAPGAEWLGPHPADLQDEELNFLLEDFLVADRRRIQSITKQDYITTEISCQKKPVAQNKLN